MQGLGVVCCGLGDHLCLHIVVVVYDVSLQQLEGGGGTLITQQRKELIKEPIYATI